MLNITTVNFILPLKEFPGQILIRKKLIVSNMMNDDSTVNMFFVKHDIDIKTTLNWIVSDLWMVTS